ncbi:InlB B-repeat-containing protein [Thiobaca trueperi]|uniref:VCBS repeat protein n=1 Tax=Thiobaca trueperi TaxID=127458 RepID=A0A4R3MZU0_9GAMM|nr:FG-GAP-like repeat-containing protein [Thiobaca trueperi]TCT21397.1 VCBS repeat protein [Thiobaca trueperi]
MKNHFDFSLKVSFLFILIFSSKAVFSAQSYVLEWDPVDDERVSGYTIYYGEAPRQYDHSLDVGNQTSFTFSDLDPNVIYYFSVKARGNDGSESGFSNELTSGSFRYVVGGSALSNKSGWIEVADLNRLFEQEVPVGWAEYNALNGEARVATGDLDGDGRDEIVIGFGQVTTQPGMPGGRFQILDDDFSHLLWGQISWPDYNTANGETYPAIGDLDGDGKNELLIGLGAGGQGLIQVFRVENGALAPLGWTAIDWPEYNQSNGAARPAVGDLDGDGRDEIVIGLGPVAGRADIPGGTFFVKKGFDSAALAAASADRNQLLVEEELLLGDLSWAEYAGQSGETRPAIGDMNGDGSAEIVMGLGKKGGGNVEIFDYRSAALVSMAWVGVDWPEYSALNGETRPAVGDLDADGRGELIVGLGAGGNGIVELFEDASNQFSYAQSMEFGSDEYQVGNGGLWPAFKRERADGKAVLPPTATYPLKVLKAGAGSGTVGGAGTYAVGATVSPTAKAASGSVFAGWSGACSGKDLCTVKMNAAKTVTATFKVAPKYTLTVKREGSGTVASQSTGINCGSSCKASYVSGANVTLTPKPATGHVFSGWSGGCSGTAKCVVAMSAAKTVTATFKVAPKYTLTVKHGGGGTITSAPIGIICGSDCKEPYFSGTSVTLTPKPANGYVFASWSGGVCSGMGNCVVKMNAAKTVTAAFKR